MASTAPSVDKSVGPPVLPMEIVARILRHATPSTLVSAGLACKDFHLEARQVLSNLTKRDWTRACLREIPSPVLFQLVTSLGLARPGSGQHDDDDESLEAVVWRMLFPASFLRTVPIFESMAEYHEAERPQKITFDGEKVYKAWWCARHVRTRTPVVNSISAPGSASVSCLKVRYCP
jgi:hypothetical protein